jgi:hypothetical protein
VAGLLKEASRVVWVGETESGPRHSCEGEDQTLERKRGAHLPLPVRDA